MNLIRLVVIGLIIYLVIYMFKRWLKTQNKTPASAKPVTEQKMVRCVVCKLHVPETEALSYQGKYFCSAEHRDNQE